MLTDLENVIKLQQLEDSSSECRTQIDALPERVASLETRLSNCLEDVSKAKLLLEEHKTKRTLMENELAQVQTQLSRFKEQLMKVKTNKEYQAMQIEIASGDKKVSQLEDTILEQMLEADDLANKVKQAEKFLADERKTADKERTTFEQERLRLKQQLEHYDSNRLKLVNAVTPQTMSLFNTLLQQRRGLAVAEVRNGHCLSCQVRLRPQLLNDIRLNNSLIQCESCQRILHYSEDTNLNNDS